MLSHFKREQKAELLGWIFVRIKKVLDLPNSMKCWRGGMAELRVRPPNFIQKLYSIGKTIFKYLNSGAFSIHSVCVITPLRLR